MGTYDPVPLQYVRMGEEEQTERALAFLELCSRRRSVRTFSSRPVPRALLETIVKTAATAPSGANKQPWRFVVVDDPALKHEIRVAAESEEKQSYEHRMPDSWLADLEELGTDWQKEFLEVAPYLIIVFKEKYRQQNGVITKNYYVEESVGIACGFLLAAIHNAGLAALTHTPSPMNFLRDILHRPHHEVPYLLIPVGYPADNTVVPAITRKPFSEVAQFNRHGSGQTGM
jgi:iodotyrosine deiodinase